MQRLIGRLVMTAMLAGLPLAAASAQVMNQDDCKRPGGCPPGSSRPGGVELAPSAPMGQTRGIAPRPAAPATKPAQLPEAAADVSKQKSGTGQPAK